MKDKWSPVNVNKQNKRLRSFVANAITDYGNSFSDYVIFLHTIIYMFVYIYIYICKNKGESDGQIKLKNK